MEAVDSTVVNTAIPAMSASLHVYPIDLKIALISYLLSLSIFIPISGWLADKFGMKRIFITALIIFTISSFFCGFAHDVKELVIARFLQGLGGAMNLPVGRLIIIRTFERHQLIVIMSRIVVVAALGMMLGPAIGGMITDHFAWYWIFWVNIPVGCLAILLSFRHLTEFKLNNAPRLDKIGFILFGLGLAGFTLGISGLSETEIQPFWPLILIIISIFLLVLYFVHSRRKKHPIIKTDLLRIRTFRISVLGNLVTRIGFGGIPFLVPLLLQIGLNYSAQTSGLLLAPLAIGVMAIRPFVLPTLRFTGYKKLLLINTVFAGIAIWLFMLVGKTTPLWIIGLFSCIYGFAISLQYSVMNSLAYADIPAETLSAATSIMSTMQQVSQSFGVAACALLIRVISWASGKNITANPEVFHLTFFFVGIITLFSAILFFRLKAEDGVQMLT